jgi:hypothetical protein
VRLNEDNSGVLDFHVFRRVDAKQRFRLTLRDTRLRLGIQLRALLSLPEAVERSAHKR